jgi:HECT-domain (ubiquitin-transferase)
VESDVFGARISEELIPGGASTPVTNANKLQFVHLIADWHLRRRVGPAAAAFSQGLFKVVPPAWLRLFSPREINQLLGGGEGGGIDITDWKKNTQYGGGYSSMSRTVHLFWKVVAGLSNSERAALLKFATSCGRPPLGGFQHLTPPFTLYKVEGGGSVLAFFGGQDADRLPTASTCSNTLKLPNYKKEGTMRAKLLYAIKSGAGFDLS